MFTNLNLQELAVLGLVAFALYSASKLRDKTALISIAIGAYTVLNSATKSAETFSGSGGSFALGNVNFTEVLAWGGFLYGAYKLYHAGEVKGAIASAACLLFTGYRSFQSEQEL